MNRTVVHTLSSVICGWIHVKSRVQSIIYYRQKVKVGSWYGVISLKNHFEYVSRYFYKQLLVIIHQHDKDFENRFELSFAHLGPLAGIVSLGRKQVKLHVFKKYILGSETIFEIQISIHVQDELFFNTFHRIYHLCVWFPPRLSSITKQKSLLVCRTVASLG